MHGSTTTPTSSAPPSSSIGILSEPLPNPSLPSRLARDFYLSELAELLRLGVPFAITTLLDMLQLEIALAFAGRSPGTRCTPNGRHGLNGTDVIHNTSIDEGADGTAELAAAGLAFSLFALEVECPAIALSTAFAGRFGAAYGAKNFRSLRVHFQRSVLVAAIVVFGFSLPLLLAAPYFLVLVAPSTEVAQLASDYLLVLCPGAVGMFLACQLGIFCESLNVALAPLLSNVLLCALVAALGATLSYWLALGGMGAAFALGISTALDPVLLLAVMLFYSEIRATRFWSVPWKALRSSASSAPAMTATRDMLSVLDPRALWKASRSALGAMGSMLVVFSADQLGSFLTARLGSTELAAQTVLVNYEMLFYCLPIGFGQACTSRISQYIGKKSEARAKVVFRLTLLIQFLFGLLTGGAYVIFQYQLAELTTNKEEVIKLAVSVTLFVAIQDIAMFLNIGLNAVLEAVRVFVFSGIVWFVIYYLFALPLAVYLMFFTPGPGPFPIPISTPAPNTSPSTPLPNSTVPSGVGWGLSGYWLPFTAAAALEALPLFVYVACLDWKRVIAEADDEKGGGEKEQTEDDECDDDKDTNMISSNNGRDRAINGSLYTEAPLDSGPAHVESTTPTNDLSNERASEHIVEALRENTPLLESASIGEQKNRSQVGRMALRLWPVLVSVTLLLAIGILLRVMRPHFLPLNEHANSTSIFQNCSSNT